MLTADPVHDPSLYPIENPNPVFRAAADGLLLFANRATDGLLAAWGTSVGSFLPDEWCRRIAEALTSGQRQCISVPCGDRIYDLDLMPIPGCGYVNLYGHDVTEREAANRAREALLAESEERTRDLIRYAPTGIYEVDFRTGRFRSVNDAMCTILGYSRDELMGMTAFDLLDDEGSALFAERIRRMLAGQEVDQSVEYRVRKKDGSVIYGTLSVRVTCHDGQPDGAFVIAHDITERRRAAERLAVQREELQAANSQLEALTESLADRERFLASILENVPVQIAYLDENLIYRQCNQAAAAEMGRPVENILGRHLRDLNADNPQVWEAVEAVLRTEQPFRSEELPVRWPDRPELGTQYYTVAYLPDRDASGRVRGVFAEGQRVTALVEARQALQEARDELEQRVQERTAELEAIFASIPEAVYLGNSNGMTYCNQVALDTLGIESIAELQGGLARTCELLQTRNASTGEPIPAEKTAFALALGGKAHTYEVVTRRVNTGQDVIQRVAASPVLLNGEVIGAVAISSDITERKRAEEKLRDSRQQLRVLSHRLIEAAEDERRVITDELHDRANQLLTALMIGLHILEKRYDGSEEASRHIAYLQRIADDLARCMHDVAVSLRPACLDRVGLAPALRQLTEMFEPQAHLSIDLITTGLHERLGPDVETAIYRVVQEALTNVVRHAQATRAGVVVQRNDGHVTAIIEDDGKGFDLDGASSAGGLGLTGMRERVEMLSGTLTIETSPGGGTAIIVDLPFPAKVETQDEESTPA